MATAARTTFPIIPLLDEREPTESERLDLMTAHCHDVISENALLRCENAALERMAKSLTARTRAMEKALTALTLRAPDFRVAPAPLGVYTDMPRLVIAAHTIEALGDVAACRWARNGDGVIVGVELSYLEGAHTAGEIERCAAEMGEMAVIGGDDLRCTSCGAPLIDEARCGVCGCHQ